MEDKRFELIECIKQYPVIYDPRHPHHSNKNKLADAWKTIALQSKIQNGKEASKKFKHLKDFFRKLNKKVKQNADDSFNVKWQFYEKMKYFDTVNKSALSGTEENIQNDAERVPSTVAEHVRVPENNEDGQNFDDGHNSTGELSTSWVGIPGINIEHIPPASPAPSPVDRPESSRNIHERVPSPVMDQSATGTSEVTNQDVRHLAIKTEDESECRSIYCVSPTPSLVDSGVSPTEDSFCRQFSSRKRYTDSALESTNKTAKKGLMQSQDAAVSDGIPEEVRLFGGFFTRRLSGLPQRTRDHVIFKVHCILHETCKDQ